MRQRDFYTKMAVQEGYRARSSFKLKQINAKYHMIRLGSSVLDLGCWPGGWLIAAKEMSKKGLVVGVDLTKISPVPGVEFMQGDIFSEDVEKRLFDYGSFDVVMSDMAPKTSGIKSLDVGRSIALSERALELAFKFLKSGGSFLCKVFQGEGFNEFLVEVRKHFDFCKSVKPEASRKESKEIYIIAMGFKGV